MVDLDELLEKTSRTFALSIPLLPEPTRREVTLAYLLFRIADTLEDAASWSQEKRIAALATFGGLLAAPDRGAAEHWAASWAAEVPIDHAGYQELLRAMPAVLDAFFALDPLAREHIRHHTVRTAEGMASFVARTDGQGDLCLESLEELQAYCYVVAGIVGEVCTELFLLDRDELTPHAESLRSRARSFGEALQLVNILKDADFDATEGRSYLPPAVDRSTVFALARSDLESARDYVMTLQEAGTERGIIAFNALPVLLAFATLNKVEAEGPGTKISRPEVYGLVAAMEEALDAGRPVIPR